ncbi:hypothetical protein, partial [Xanthomonas cissicola]|uniref:hypothetical protein n=1 Tax=Xanthomonas cissicola TaxID=86186 RepID=UPI001AD6ECB8
MEVKRALRSARAQAAWPKNNSSSLKNPCQTSIAMFASRIVLEHVEERSRTTCNQARKKAIQRS